MVRCDSCGKMIDYLDFKNGAQKAIHDQPETDNLCITCNSEEIENVGMPQTGTQQHSTCES